MEVLIIMKKIAIVFVLLILTNTASAAQDGIGLGVILGEPTGVTFKTWIDGKTAIDAAAAWSFSGNNAFQLHADYLIHPFDMPKPREVSGKVSFYYGFGGRIKLQESASGKSQEETADLLGIRFPVGFSHVLAKAPVEFFAEIVPVLNIVPDTDVDLDGAIGARYYFK
jgi:hypothetical protein